jgi:excinuclease ABC subunit C
MNVRDIKGIGEKKANLLLKHFGSISKIKKADIAQLIAVKGITEENAKMIFDFFKNL